MRTTCLVYLDDNPWYVSRDFLNCLQRWAAVRLCVTPFCFDTSTNDALGAYERTILGDARLVRSFSTIVHSSCVLQHHWSLSQRVRCFPQRKYLPEC